MDSTSSDQYQSLLDSLRSTVEGLRAEVSAMRPGLGITSPAQVLSTPTLETPLATQGPAPSGGADPGTSAAASQSIAAPIRPYNGSITSSVAPPVQTLPVQTLPITTPVNASLGGFNADFLGTGLHLANSAPLSTGQFVSQTTSSSSHLLPDDHPLMYNHVRQSQPSPFPLSVSSLMPLPSSTLSAFSSNLRVANNARTSSAEQTRGPRPRGRANPTSSLLNRTTTVAGSSQNRTLIRAPMPTEIGLCIRILPPMSTIGPRANSTPVAHHARQYDFDERLHSFGLLHELDGWSTAQTLPDICAHMERQVATGPFQYQWPALQHGSSASAFSSLAFDVLVVSTRRRGVTFHYQRVPTLPDSAMRISSLMNDARFAGHPGDRAPTLAEANRRHMFWTNGRLNITLAFKVAPLTGIFPGNPQRHSCMARRIMSSFATDTAEEQYWLQSNPDYHLGEELTSDEEEEEEVEEIVHPTRRVGRRGHPYAYSPRSSSPTLPNISSPSLPSRVFGDFSPQSDAQYRTTTMRAWQAKMTEVANEGNLTPNRLDLRAPSAAGLAELLRQRIATAVELGDGTLLLPTDNWAAITGVTRTNGSWDASASRSHGAGVLNEAYSLLFKSFSDQFSTFFILKAGDFLSVAPGPSVMNPLLASPARLHAFQELGASLLAYLVHTGALPLDISPLLLQLMVHNLNIHSLTRELVNSVVPEVCSQVIQWRSIGFEAIVDNSVWRDRFINIFDSIMPATINNRTPEIHDAMEHYILVESTVGRLSPEISAMMTGFNLPFHNGRNASDIIRSFDGGSSAFSQQACARFIRNAEALQPILDFNSRDRGFDTWTIRLQTLCGPTVTFESILRGFLRGQGKINAQEFDGLQAAGIWDPVDDSEIEDPGFRSRLFYRAATGSHTLLSNNRLTVVWSTVREEGVIAGFLKWKTCACKVIIPVHFMLELLEIAFTAPEPQDVETGVHFWLLKQSLIGVGQHGFT